MSSMAGLRLSDLPSDVALPERPAQYRGLMPAASGPRRPGVGLQVPRTKAAEEPTAQSLSLPSTRQGRMVPKVSRYVYRALCPIRPKGTKSRPVAPPSNPSEGCRHPGGVWHDPGKMRKTPSSREPL